MTIETPRLPPSAAAGPDAGLIAGLWEEAPFPRLPWDAPQELRDLVEEVENPRRVYAIHCASRRHRFQMTVQKYIVQLRDGCGDATCCNSTCLTCRKRIAGHAPIRQYNTISARTLAIHLASQDNPEAGLCPALKLPKAPPAALNSLVFAPKFDAGPSAYRPQSTARSGGDQLKDRTPGTRIKARRQDDQGEAESHTRRQPIARESSSGENSNGPVSKSRRPATGSAGARGATEETWTEPNFTVRERVVKKDHRSFAANMFGTVAFKMLEWLTPTAVEDMTETAGRLQGGTLQAKKTIAASLISSGVSTPEDLSLSAPTESTVEGDDAALDDEGVDIGNTGTPLGRHDSKHDEKEPSDAVGNHDQSLDSKTNGGNLWTGAGKPPATQSNDSQGPAPALSALPIGQTAAASSAVRNASARVRTPTSTKRPQHKLSMEPFATDTDDLLPALRSPLLSAVSTDGVGHKTQATKPLKSSTPTIPRPISQLSNAGYFDGVSLEKMPPLKTSSTDPKSKAGRSPFDLSMRSGSDSSVPQSVTSSSRSLSLDRSAPDRPSLPLDVADADAGAGADANAEADSDADLDGLLPQTLTRLNTEVIDFICEVLQQDHDREYHFLEPPVVKAFHTPYKNQPLPLQRKQQPGPPRGAKDADILTVQWRLFINQSLFYVLSSPQALLQSFTSDRQLYDTHTLWYCMLRLTRVAPNIVLHSLWTAAESLFTPSKALLTQRLPGARLSPSILTDAEAGRIMAICLHALVGVAPVVNDVRKLYDMSRMRAQGTSLSGGASIFTPSTNLSLQYNDAFSYDQAIRLARRLFSAITARRFYAGMARDTRSHKAAAAPSVQEPIDVLAPLFDQLDFLNMDAAYILNFSVHERTLHETRMPTLLLDWARTVMMQDWNGSPIVPADGPFGGALALISAIHKRRQDLLVGDIQFRLEYFAERLEDLEMPIAWLSFTSTTKKSHLLDFPFLFSPASLVSYFRAINFSRMSRSYENSSSLQSRMNAIISPGSLIINPYHKVVLQDLLRTASAKYLILDVSRRTALQDTFDQLFRREQRELQRPLKVHLGEYDGEEGFDSGGVQQEYFRLAIAEALDPRFGAFTVDERTHMTWFNPTTLEEDWKFELIGLIFSLALFNGVSLPVTLPKALYRKLLGEPVNELHHISDGWPDLANGLTALLEWNEQDGAVEDVFVRTYEFSVDMFGKPISRVMGDSQLWPQIREAVTDRNSNRTASHHAEDQKAPSTATAESLVDGNPGDDAPMVTNENRSAYVTDYIRYLTDVSVRPQYEAFARGFRKCLHPKSLKLLNSNLLQSLLEGQQDIDVEELMAHARYVGWDANHHTVREFWSIVSKYDDRMKRKLLEFVTASDRLPVGGAKNLQFVVQRNGEEPGEGGHLPTAYTCYGILLLPEYETAEALEERLSMALENAQGFGFA